MVLCTKTEQQLDISDELFFERKQKLFRDTSSYY